MDENLFFSDAGMNFPEPPANNDLFNPTQEREPDPPENFNPFSREDAVGSNDTNDINDSAVDKDEPAPYTVEEIGQTLIDALETAFGKEEGQRVCQAIADEARANPDMSFRDIIEKNVLDAAERNGMDPVSMSDAVMKDFGQDDPRVDTGFGGDDSGEGHASRYDELKEKFEALREKYMFNNTFTVAARLEFNIEAARENKPGADGKAVSGGDIAMDVLRLLRTNVLESLFEIGLRAIFDKIYSPHEDDKATVDDSDEATSGKAQDERTAEYGTDKSGAYRDDGFVDTRSEQFTKDNIFTRDNPSAGFYMGVDMKSDPDSRVSDISTTVWRTGKDEVDSVFVGGKMETLRIPGIRMVEFNDTRYLVDPFGKVITHDGDRTSGEKFPDYFPRLDISASNHGKELIAAAAEGKHMTVNEYKSGLVSDAKEHFIEKNIGRFEAHSEYIKDTIIPEIRGQVDKDGNLVDERDKGTLGDYRDKIDALSNRIDEVRALRTELDSKPVEERGFHDHEAIAKCDEKIEKMESAKEKLESAASKLESRLERLENTVKEGGIYDNAIKVASSEKYDIEAKFGVVASADKDAAGKVSGYDDGLSSKDWLDINETMRDLDTDPRDVADDESERQDVDSYDSSVENPGTNNDGAVEPDEDGKADRVEDIDVGDTDNKEQKSAGLEGTDKETGDNVESGANETAVESQEKTGDSVDSEHGDKVESSASEEAGETGDVDSSDKTSELSEDEILDKIEESILKSGVGYETPEGDIGVDGHSDISDIDPSYASENDINDTSADTAENIEAQAEAGDESDLGTEPAAGSNDIETESFSTADLDYDFFSMSDDEFSSYIEKRFGDTSFEDGVIGDVPLTRDEYVEAVKMIRDGDGAVGHDEIEERFGFDASEVEEFTEIGDDGSVIELEGPPTEEEWKAFEELEAKGIRAPYFADVNEDGSTRIDIQTPPDDAFWERLDAVIPPPDRIPYSDTATADKLHSAIQGYYSDFNRDITSNPPAYTERMSEFSDHIKDVNSNRLADGFTLPDRACNTAAEWKDLQLERYVESARTVQDGIGFEKDNIRAYIEAKSYDAFDSDANLQFVYDNVGPDEYDKVLSEYHELTGRTEFLDELDAACGKIERIATSEMGVDEKLNAIGEVFNRYFSPEINDIVRLEAFKEDKVRDLDVDQTTEVAQDNAEAQVEEQPADPNLDAAEAKIETGTQDAEKDNPETKLENKPEDTEKDNSENKVEEKTSDTERENAENKVEEKVSDTEKENPDEKVDRPSSSETVENAQIDAAGSSERLESQAGADITTESTDVDASELTPDLVEAPDSEPRDISAEDTLNNDNLLDKDDERQANSDLSSDKTESKGDSDDPNSTSDKKDLTSTDIAAAAGSDIDEDDDPASKVDFSEIDKNDSSSKDEFEKAVDKYLNKESDDTFSFKEDFLDKHNPSDFNIEEMYDVLADKISDAVSASDGEDTETMFDRVLTLFDNIEDCFVEGLTEYLEHQNALYESFVDKDAISELDAVLNAQLDSILDSVEGPLEAANMLVERYDPDWNADIEAVKEAVCDKIEMANLNEDAIDKVVDIVQALDTIFHGFESILTEIGSVFSAYEDPVAISEDIAVDAGTMTRYEDIDVSAKMDTGFDPATDVHEAGFNAQLNDFNNNDLFETPDASPGFNDMASSQPEIESLFPPNNDMSFAPDMLMDGANIENSFADFANDGGGAADVEAGGMDAVGAEGAEIIIPL
ncbi:MAG: hypothetical protein GXY05_06805 [Clostridiales bacterium]|nr:hypothetical protein [Clostridiales bacterium]